jgi:hypothetical protein
VISTDETAPDPFAPVDGLGLPAYVDVCRELVRTAGDSTRRIELVLAAHDLTPDRWGRINEEWSERIRRQPRIRTEFRRLYAGAPSQGQDGPVRNE